jgi:hypothetical protein
MKIILEKQRNQLVNKQGIRKEEEEEEDRTNQLGQH